VPAGVSGCALSMMFKIGSTVSNSVTIRAATNGRVCTPAHPAISVTRAAELYAKPVLTIGLIRMSASKGRERPRILNGNAISHADTGLAKFTRVNGSTRRARTWSTVRHQPGRPLLLLKLSCYFGPALSGSGSWRRFRRFAGCVRANG